MHVQVGSYVHVDSASLAIASSLLQCICYSICCLLLSYCPPFGTFPGHCPFMTSHVASSNAVPSLQIPRATAWVLLI